MVKKMMFCVFLLTGVVAAPHQAMAGCSMDLLDCYTRAAKIDSFWYRTAAGLDCELQYAGCVRQTLIGA